MSADLAPSGAVLYLAWNFKLRPIDLWTLRQTQDILCLPSFFNAKSFPPEIIRSELLACVQFGISLRPGVPANAWEADSFKIVAVVVYGEVPEEAFKHSNVETNMKYPGYYKSLVLTTKILNDRLVAFMQNLPQHDILDMSYLQGVENFDLSKNLLRLVDHHSLHRREFVSEMGGISSYELRECRHR